MFSYTEILDADWWILPATNPNSNNTAVLSAGFLQGVPVEI